MTHRPLNRPPRRQQTSVSLEDAELDEINSEGIKSSNDEDVITAQGAVVEADDESSASPSVTIGPANVKERYSRLIALSFAVMMCLTVWFSATAVIPQLAIVWSLDASSSTALTAVVQIGFAVGAILLSIFSIPDRVPARILFLIALFNGLIAAWKEFPFVVIMRFFTGCAVALIYPPGMRILSTWFLEDRGLAIGILIGAFCFGSGGICFTLSPLISTFVVALFDSERRSLPSVDITVASRWELIIYVTSGLALIGGIVTFFVGIDGPFIPNRAKFKWGTIIELYKDRGFLFPVLGYYAHKWEIYSSWAWIARFYAAVLDQSDPSDPFGNQSKASFVAFAFIAFGGVGAIVGGKLADHWGRPQTIILCNIITALCSFSIGFFTFTPVGAGIIAMIWGFWVPADSAQYSAMITELVADRSQVGTALMIQTGSGYFLSVISVFLVPVLAPYLTWTWLFTILTPGPICAILCMVPVFRTPKRG